MTWMRPLNPWLAPGLLLAVGALVILSDGFGFESFLSKLLFDAYRQAAPASTNTTSPVDPTKLNVIYTAGNGTRSLVPSDPVNGWTVDNPNDPTRVLLHGSSCEQAKSDTAGRMLVVLGCKTVLK